MPGWLPVDLYVSCDEAPVRGNPRIPALLSRWALALTFAPRMLTKSVSAVKRTLL